MFQKTKLKNMCWGMEIRRNKMFKESTNYTILCDSCSIDLFANEEHSGYNDREFVLEIAQGLNWLEYENDDGDFKHYCPDCYLYDDNDNLIIKEIK